MAAISLRTDLASDELWLEAVHRRVRQMPNERWLVQPTGGGVVRDYTWATAVDEAKRVAAHLRSAGYPPGSSIAILSQNCAHFILMDLAIWFAGHVTVPLYPTMLPETIRYVLEHCQARAIFIGKLPAMPSGALPAGIDGLACALSPPTSFPNWEDIVARTSPIAGEPARAAEDIAAIMYTSGTTGRPKGVELSFGAMAVTTRALHDAFDGRVSSDDRTLSYLPLAHAAERVMVQGMSLAYGIRVYFSEALDTFADDLKRARPTLFVGVPRVWVKFRDKVLAKIPDPRLRRMLRTPILGRMVKRKILVQLGLDAVRITGTGAAPTPPEVIAFFSSLGLEFWELYGMTENFAHSHFCSPAQRRPGRIAPPFPGVEVRIADDGEIQIKTPAVMRGYHRDPEATANAFTADGFLRTGDCGDQDTDGFLRITGRIKEIFKTSKAKYVAPAGIENSLVAGGMFEVACVMGAGEPQPFAIAVLSEGGRERARDAEDRRRLTAELEALLVQVNGGLPSHERLSRLVVSTEPWTVEAGLLTPTLKIKRAPIEARFAARVAATAPGVSWLAP